MSSDERGDKGWRAGETFFEESGGKPALAAGDEGGSEGGEDTHLPASEADSDALAEERKGEPQSWPGKGGPGTFLPPGCITRAEGGPGLRAALVGRRAHGRAERGPLDRRVR